MYVTSGQGGSLAIYERLANGLLEFDQLLSGSQGLDLPGAVAAPGALTVAATVSANTITFTNPANPDTPVNYGFHTGDAFVYQGPAPGAVAISVS